VPARARFHYGYFLVLGGIFIFGAFLRLHMLGSQILVDDEWHSINHVLGKTFTDLVLHYTAADNASPPLNLYCLALLKSVGWFECQPLWQGSLRSLSLRY
jgi:hypothetical protein